MVFIGIDEPLFDKHNRNLTDVVQLAQDHVDGLNEIFISQVVWLFSWFDYCQDC